VLKCVFFMLFISSSLTGIKVLHRIINSSVYIIREIYGACFDNFAEHCGAYVIVNMGLLFMHTKITGSLYE